jgi:hypothetical protein
MLCARHPPGTVSRFQASKALRAALPYLCGALDFQPILRHKDTKTAPLSTTTPQRYIFEGRGEGSSAANPTTLRPCVRATLLSSALTYLKDLNWHWNLQLTENREVPPVTRRRPYELWTRRRANQSSWAKDPVLRSLARSRIAI